MWKKNETENIDEDLDGNSSAVISPKSVTIGEIKGNEDLLILGTFEGNVSLLKNNVNVGKTGYVKGSVHSQSIMVEGKVEGDLKANERIILRKNARIKGNIITNSLIMEDGCIFQGNVQMTVETAKPITSGVSSPIDKLNPKENIKKTA